nr:MULTISPECIES: phage tail terminator-like protein [unclassified Providencia]
MVAQIAKREGLKVAWPNIAFDDINAPYLQMHIMPASTENMGLALDMTILKGVIQINLVGKVGSGDEQLSLIADNIKTQLENGLTMTDTLYLNSEPSQFPPLAGDTHYTIPIRTSYRCDSVR